MTHNQNASGNRSQSESGIFSHAPMMPAEITLGVQWNGWLIDSDLFIQETEHLTAKEVGLICRTLDPKRPPKWLFRCV